MPQGTAESRLDWQSVNTADSSSLLSSWPQIPRQSYALESIGQQPSPSRPSGNSSRLSPIERRSPYPSLRYTSNDMATQSHHTVRHERILHASTTQRSLRSSTSVSTTSPAHDSLGYQLRPDVITQPAHAPSTSREAQHKVYLLNCKHCGNFLSDRGMKAVLLLKPNITLYSTDIVPTTCGPYFTSTTFHGGVDPIEPPIERTCECLTQTLGCYGCGAQVGYNIISPCAQCTNSVMKHQRSSNGHRTVLHCSEISVRERRYVCGEPGVRAARPLPSSERLRQVYLEQTRNRSTQPELYRLSNSTHRDLYLPNLAQTLAEDDDLEGEKSEAGTAYYQQQQQHHQLLNSVHHDRPRISSTALRPSENPTGSRFLRRGDVLFWSDLIAGGERAQPFDPDPILERPVACR